MSKKYILTDETIECGGRTLHRIKAIRDFGEVKSGDLGGFIEKEENLSHEGNAWVSDNARVYGSARVCGNAEVFGGAEVYGDARVSKNTRVFGDAEVFGEAWIYGNARVSGDAEVIENARVRGNAEVKGKARVCGNAEVKGNAEINGNDDYLCFKGLGSYNRNTTVFKSKKGIEVACGCFSGTLEEFQNQVIETHGDNKFAKEYLAMIELVKIHFDIS